MTILRRQFYGHERGNHDETFFSLARDTETDRVFIIHEWFRKSDVGEKELTLDEFYAMAHGTSVWTRFLSFIGTLATEPTNT
jgi:oligoribonuclease NrnB/cAMP/cGMP phosphodiesterase (DHH superfamily)